VICSDPLNSRTRASPVTPRCDASIAARRNSISGEYQKPL
jgi:hypothetical protein